MKSLFFLGLLLSNFAIGADITGEWTYCEKAGDGIVLYTTVLTNNFRHEVLLFGEGKNCKEIETKAFAAAISISKMTSKDNFVSYQRDKTSFVSFDDARKEIIGNAEKCNFDHWLKTLDPKCGLNADFSPELKEDLMKVIKREDGKKYKLKIINNYLHEDLFPNEGLFPSKIYDSKLFK